MAISRPLGAVGEKVSSYMHEAGSRLLRVITERVGTLGTAFLKTQWLREEPQEECFSIPHQHYNVTGSGLKNRPSRPICD